jgi:hypothetical protein
LERPAPSDECSVLATLAATILQIFQIGAVNRIFESWGLQDRLPISLLAKSASMDFVDPPSPMAAGFSFDFKASEGMPLEE